MEKPFRFGFLLGRFQPIHKGHEYMIDAALCACEHVLVLVGSSQLHGTVRNPLSTDFRMELLRKLYGERIYLAPLPDFTHEDDHSLAWGRYLLDSVASIGRQYGIQSALDLMVYGNDEERGLWLAKEEASQLNHLQLSRTKLPITATQVRELIVRNDRAAWETCVSGKLHGDFERIREELLRIDYYRKLAAKGARRG